MKNDSTVLYTFATNKSNISQKKIILLKAFNSEFQKIEVWFTDQNSQPLQIEDKINLTLMIK